MATTIKEVAALARVSPSTVSRVLRGTLRKPETCSRVMKAAARLEYQPNELARSLKDRRTRTLAVLVPDITYPLFPELVRSIEEAAHQRGYHIVLCNTNEDPEKEGEILDGLSQRWVAGVIMCGVQRDSPNLVSLLSKSIPVAMVDRVLDGLPVSLVSVDNLRGAHEATKHLIGLGHERIGFIAGPHTIRNAVDRLWGYRQALQDSGFRFDEGLTRTGDFRMRSGYAAAASLIDSASDVTAIFASNDLMALGAMRAIAQRGLRVPDDIAVVGFDDIPLCSLVTPALTTLAQPIDGMGKECVRVLVDQIEGAGSCPTRLILEGRLVVRDSSVKPEPGRQRGTPEAFEIPRSYE